MAADIAADEMRIAQLHEEIAWLHAQEAQLQAREVDGIRRAKLNKKLSIEGRTANQYKKWLQKNSDTPKIKFGLR